MPSPFHALVRNAALVSTVPVLFSLSNELVDPMGGDSVTVVGANLSSATLYVGGASRGFGGATSSGMTFTAPALASLVRPTQPDFNGSSSRIASSYTLSNLISASSWSAWVLFYADSAPSDSGPGSRYQNAQFFGDSTNAVIAFGFSTAGVHIVCGPAGTIEVVAPCGPGWHLAQVKYDGTNVKLRVDKGPWYTAAAGNTSAPYMTNTVKFGCSYSDVKFFDGRMADVGITNTTLSDAIFDDLVGYVNQQHRTAIGGVAPTSFDPATLSLTGWWRAGGYAAAATGTWTGRTSAGTSGLRSLTQATNFPSASTAGWPGFYDVYVTTGAGTSNTLTLEVWDPSCEITCTLLYDAKHTAYGAGTGTWAPRFTRTVAPTDTLEMTSFSSGNHAASSGAPVFDGDGAVQGGLKHPDIAWSAHYFGPNTGGYVKGGLFGVVSYTNSQSLQALEANAYSDPAVMSTGSGTVGITAGLLSGVPSIRAYVWDGSGSGYRAATVPASQTDKHMVLARWSLAGTLDLSLDGALSGAGYASRALVNGLGADYLAYVFRLGLTHPANDVTLQQFAGTVPAWGCFNEPPADYIVTKLDKWRRAHAA